MGHYFNKIELEELDVKIENLPSNLMVSWYRKGWVLQSVERKDGKLVVQQPVQYPICVYAYLEEFLQSLEPFGNDDTVKELKNKVEENFDGENPVSLWIG